MRRIRIHLAYDGGPFHGWQVQPGLPTIQGILEQIVGDIEGKPVHVAGSRTHRRRRARAGAGGRLQHRKPDSAG